MEKEKGLCKDRGRLDIIKQILEISKDFSNQTSLTQDCALNLSQVSLFTNCLVATGLLKVSTSNSVEIFETTEKGNDFLQDYSQIENILSKK